MRLRSVLCLVLLCITLIFCGQSAATHVPNDIGPVYHDPLKTGLAFIWVGNAHGAGGGGVFDGEIATAMSVRTLGATGNTNRAARLGRMWMTPAQTAALTVAWAIFRCIFSATRQLAPDEAYYWVWSRHPELSYFDHPPMVAWMIRAGTAAAGVSEFGVRWIAAVMGVVVVLALGWAARRMVGGLAAGFVPIALLTSPIFNVSGSIVTPDTPASFFQALALVCVLGIFLPDAKRFGAKWMGFGVCTGLALLSKYTSVLLGVAVLGCVNFFRGGAEAVADDLAVGERGGGVCDFYAGHPLEFTAWVGVVFVSTEAWDGG